MNRRRLDPLEAARAHAPYVLCAVAMFVATAVVGAAAQVGGGPSPQIVPIEDLGGSSLEVWPLFVHNTSIAMYMAFGFLLFGLPTVYLLAYNGFVLGGTFVVALETLGVVAAIAAIGPHAIVELPALWLGAAIGFRISHFLWRVAQAEERSYPLHVGAAQTAIAILVVVGLLAVAAWIEATVTPAVVATVLE